jgi:hypothetical protein
MPSGPRFPIGPDRSVSWKHTCKKDESMMAVYRDRNLALASMPTNDALGLFMSKFSPAASLSSQKQQDGRSNNSTAQPSSRDMGSEYQYSPLDGYSRATKDSAALQSAQVPLSSMRVLPLPPQDGSRPYERPPVEVVRNSTVYKKGGFLATSNEVYGWQHTSDDCKPQQWHGRKRYDEDTSKKAPEGTSPWHGRKKWTESN